MFSMQTSTGLLVCTVALLSAEPGILKSKVCALPLSPSIHLLLRSEADSLPWGKTEGPRLVRRVLTAAEKDFHPVLALPPSATPGTC